MQRLATEQTLDVKTFDSSTRSEGDLNSKARATQKILCPHNVPLFSFHGSPHIIISYSERTS